MAVKYVTAGESHGKMLVGIISGIPAGLYIDGGFVNGELKRRMQGFGRGGRMKIESDCAEFVTGVRAHYSMGSPITAIIYNKDFENWQKVMGENAEPNEMPSRRVTAVRPGHADLSGVIKYGFDDARNVLERASARETAMRTALGAVAKLYLKSLGIEIGSHTVSIGGVTAQNVDDYSDLNARADGNEVRCLDKAASSKMVEEIKAAAADGDTLGGVVEVVVTGCKSGIGSYVSEMNKLDGIIMREVGCVQSVKAVEIGCGIQSAAKRGGQVHDEIYPCGKGFMRETNRAGGIEGGMTNGEHIIVRAYCKPIPTLRRGLNTVDIATCERATAANERSDVCAVPAAGVVCEAAVALALCEAISDMLGGDSMKETVKRYNDKESCNER